MDILPNELLDVIYKYKHKLEFNDVHNELKQIYILLIDKVYQLIEMFQIRYSCTMNIYDEIVLYELYSSLRNDGVIDDYELLYFMTLNTDLLLFEKQQYYYNSKELSIRNVIDKYKYYLGSC